MVLSPQDPDEILKVVKSSVFFIYRMNGGDPSPAGTGFIVSVKLRPDDDRYKQYLVTAKHVIQKKNGSFISSIKICLNKKNNGAELGQIPLNPSTLLTHEENEVDLAVIPFGPNEDFDYTSNSDEIIPDYDAVNHLKLTKGDKIFFCGLKLIQECKERIKPSSRYGTIFSISDEKSDWINIQNQKIKTELYLIDGIPQKGFSGSPVMFDLRDNSKKDQEGIGHTVYLCGIVSGYRSPNYDEHVQKGIGCITPAYKLREILFSKKATELRECDYKNYLKGV